jgi:hypothetical protein
MSCFTLILNCLSRTNWRMTLSTAAWNMSFFDGSKVMWLHIPHNTQKWIYTNLNFTQLSVLPVVPIYCYLDQLNITSNFTRCNKLYLDPFKCI